MRRLLDLQPSRISKLSRSTTSCEVQLVLSSNGRGHRVGLYPRLSCAIAAVHIFTFLYLQLYAALLELARAYAHFHLYYATCVYVWAENQPRSLGAFAVL
uniref:Uncharacterized protein n=1 Tax=Trichogramma kaykai TaxID=54128 RepID=A0ABD2WRW9_9HYME